MTSLLSSPTSTAARLQPSWASSAVACRDQKIFSRPAPGSCCCAFRRMKACLPSASTGSSSNRDFGCHSVVVLAPLLQVLWQPALLADEIQVAGDGVAVEVVVAVAAAGRRAAGTVDDGGAE